MVMVKVINCSISYQCLNHHEMYLSAGDPFLLCCEVVNVR